MHRSQDTEASANVIKNILRVTVLLQYVPRCFRFLPLVAGHSQLGFIFETAWANFAINLFMYVLAGHVVGACWYLFGLQVLRNYMLCWIYGKLVIRKYNFCLQI